jgi:hypothetical protein
MTKNLAAPVNAKFIRTAFANGEFTAPDSALVSLTGRGVKVVKGETVQVGSGLIRGRLHPSAVAAFLAVNPDASYQEKSVAEAKMVTVPVTKTSKTGATLKRPVSLPISQVRALAGSGDKKGRLSSADVVAAARAFEAQRDAKPTA